MSAGAETTSAGATTMSAGARTMLCPEIGYNTNILYFLRH
jgi:hypothetical protein